MTIPLLRESNKSEDNIMRVYCGKDYEEAGYKAIDNMDNDVDNDILDEPKQNLC